jgi:hypothetical protein
MQNTGKRMAVTRLEKLIIGMLVVAGYFAVIYHPGDAVFIGEFNNKDGSIYAARGVDVIVSLVIFFTVAFLLIPKKLLKSRYLAFAAGSALIIGSMSAVEYGLDRVILHLFNLPTAPHEISDKMIEYPSRHIYYSTIIPGNIMVYVLAFLYGLSRDWIAKSRRQNELQKEKMRANIDFLRSQINPHFFFNALNNIYAITRKNRDREAGDAIMKLSAVMRYMIYDSDADQIGLDKEVKHIRQYIELVRQKFGPDDSVDLVFSAEGDLEKHRIAPLVLLPFVENGCKYGLTPTGKGYVHITLALKDHRLMFQVANPRYGTRYTDPKHPGVGLENVRKRLNLLYPDRHVLQIKEDDVFTIDLTIDFRE